MIAYRRSLPIVLSLLLSPMADAWAWGQEGHSIIAEIAQRRLSPQAAAAVTQLLGPGHSLASVGSWADDVRDQRPETYNWHFVDIPIAEKRYDPAKHCAPSDKGDCIVAELDRLRKDLRCAPTIEAKREALQYAVHFVGDVHQPLHTVDEARGGNDIAVEVRLSGAKSCRGGPCPVRVFRSNFHAVWDVGLIQATTWNWGAYVERLESNVLPELQAKLVAGSSPAAWAEEAHHEAEYIWRELPTNYVIDDAYYQKVLPTLDRQLALAGLRLASFLNDAYRESSCQR